MTDFILNPFTIISALIAVAVLIFGCGKWVGRVNSEQQAIRDSFEDVKGWIDEIRKDVGTLREGVAKLIGRLEERPTVESGSPLHLTDFGEELAESLDAKKWAEAEAARMLPDAKDMQPFEIDDTCVAYVMDELDDDMTRRVAELAYDQGIERQSVRNVLHVVLRDELLRMQQKREHG